MKWLFCLYLTKKKKKKKRLSPKTQFICMQLYMKTEVVFKNTSGWNKGPKGWTHTVKKKYHRWGTEKKWWCCKSPTEWVSAEEKHTNCSNQENNDINKTFLISFSFTPQWHLMSSEWKITNQNVLLSKLSKPSENLAWGQLVVFSHEYRTTFHTNFTQT